MNIVDFNEITSDTFICCFPLEPSVSAWHCRWVCLHFHHSNPALSIVDCFFGLAQKCFVWSERPASRPLQRHKIAALLSSIHNCWWVEKLVVDFVSVPSVVQSRSLLWDWIHPYPGSFRWQWWKRKRTWKFWRKRALRRRGRTIWRWCCPSYNLL